MFRDIMTLLREWEVVKGGAEIIVFCYIECPKIMLCYTIL